MIGIKAGKEINRTEKLLNEWLNIPGGIQIKARPRRGTQNIRFSHSMYKITKTGEASSEEQEGSREKLGLSESFV